MSKPHFPPISRQQLVVLKYLAEVWPIASPQIEVAAGSGFETRRTAKKYLDGLVDLNLVEYRGELRGFVINELGRQLVEFAGRKDCA